MEENLGGYVREIRDGKAVYVFSGDWLYEEIQEILLAEAEAEKTAERAMAIGDRY